MDMRNTQAQQWVRTWRQAEAALQSVKKEELRSYDYAEKLSILDDMLQWAYEHRSPRLSSGLTEQQHWFVKMREGEETRSAQEKHA